MFSKFSCLRLISFSAIYIISVWKFSYIPLFFSYVGFDMSLSSSSSIFTVVWVFEFTPANFSFPSFLLWGLPLKMVLVHPSSTFLSRPTKNDGMPGETWSSAFHLPSMDTVGRTNNS